MKYLLFYTEASSPKVVTFDSLTDAETWAGRFLLQNQTNTDDNWVDMIIKGSIERTYSRWAKEFDQWAGSVN